MSANPIACRPINLVILISGNGSNLQAIIDAVKQDHLPVCIKAVVSNNPAAYGLKRAHKAGIPYFSLELSNFIDRMAFDAALFKLTSTYSPDLIVLAGFMQILTSEFIRHYANRIVNLHPSLLPQYPGLNTHERVLENGEIEHGATVHIVTEVLDAGPIIAQAACQVVSDDTPDTLRAKVQKLEHRLYPEVIRWFVDDKIGISDTGQVTLDGVVLPEKGKRLIF